MRDASPADQFADVARQIRAMIAMVEADAPCVEVIRAGTAAKRALGRAALALLRQHLAQCLHDAAACEDAECRAASVARLAEAFEVLSRLLCPACRHDWWQ